MATPVTKAITELRKRLPKSTESVEQLKELWRGGIRQRLQAIRPAATSTDLLRMVADAAGGEFGGSCSLGAIFGEPSRVDRLADSICKQLQQDEGWFIENAEQIIRSGQADTITDEQISQRLNRLRCDAKPQELDEEPELPAYSATDVAQCREILNERWAYKKQIEAEREARIAAAMATLPPATLSTPSPRRAFRHA